MTRQARYDDPDVVLATYRLLQRRMVSLGVAKRELTYTYRFVGCFSLAEETNYWLKRGGTITDDEVVFYQEPLGRLLGLPECSGSYARWLLEVEAEAKARDLIFATARRLYKQRASKIAENNC